jgi:hypothetical protein
MSVRPAKPYDQSTLSRAPVPLAFQAASGQVVPNVTVW